MLRRKGIMDAALLAYTLLAFSSAVFSAELGKRGKKEYMGACSEVDSGILYTITNPSGATCDPSQVAGSSNPVYCTCVPDGEGSYEWVTLQSAMGSDDVDLSDYALLVGDADGQTIQGITGSNKARIEIESNVTDTIQLFGGGATPATIYVDGYVAYIASPNESSYFSAADDAILFTSAGSATLGGSTYTRLITGPAPSAANDPCESGQIAFDPTHFYYCISAELGWIRTTLSTWP